MFVLFFIIWFASSSVLFCIISNSHFNYYICWNLKFCGAESWCWWWCLYITTISALIHCVIFSVSVVHWIFYVKIQTYSLSAVEMHSKMKRGLTSNIGFLNCVTFNQLMQNTSVETWAIWLSPASWAPAINLLFAVIFPCVYDLLLQYFYGLSFLAMWAQIEDLLATKRTMSLLFDCGWWTLCPLARPDSDMGQWVVPTQQLFWFGAEVPWIPGDKALFVSLNPLPDTQPLNSRCCQPEQWGQATCSPSAWPEMPFCQENRDRSSCSNLIIYHCQASCCLPKMGQHRQSTFSGGRCYLGLLVGIVVMGEYKRPTAWRVLISQ